MNRPAIEFKKNPFDDLDSLKALNRQPTVAQMMARLAIHKALFNANADMFADIVDRVEGKATQAAPNKKNNSALDEQIDAQLGDLNKLTEGST